ncbi:uncharacterized protein PpBr36_06176 [Pyricularia pennisetigena]|uniref:uncharacterized protein n=1 Tax=Pyricularia pennisetigena TaxID=1578925 RepID=UPI00114E12DC|nr:uncharacterized protein PpBr36_06176 [Pyricularia pennisetigena]TLS22711.1 hypothetical protein PpBr36_06176 [Pyricularia pennisetigena]
MSPPNRLKYDPNPHFGHVSKLDKALAVVGYVVVAVQVVYFFLPNSRVIYWLPTSIIRRDAARGAGAFTSHRYGDRLAAFPEVIDRPEFSGIWVTKPGFTRASKPRDADVVLIYVHGGGYVTGLPEQYAGMLLRMAERIEAEGQKVAIFALRYSLAPERRFPTQLLQAAACWDYVVGEMGVLPARVALMGDSAGGSIILSLLVHMSHPLIGVERVKRPAKPGRGIFLQSPWVNPVDETGYDDKPPGTDVIGVASLRAWTVAAVTGAEDDDVERYLEFTGPRDDWDEILPAYTWVSAGGNERLLRNITRFVEAARKAGKRVDYEVRKDAVHAWQFFECMIDGDRAMAQDFGTFEDGLLAGTDGLAKAILDTPRSK